MQVGFKNACKLDPKVTASWMPIWHPNGPTQGAKSGTQRGPKRATKWTTQRHHTVVTPGWVQVVSGRSTSPAQMAQFMQASEINLFWIKFQEKITEKILQEMQWAEVSGRAPHTSGQSKADASAQPGGSPAHTEARNAQRTRTQTGTSQCCGFQVAVLKIYKK